jgi:hypothetical protein
VEICKRLTREFNQDLFEPGQKVCFTTTRQIYFIAHLTQADFSLLRVFELIKKRKEKTVEHCKWKFFYFGQTFEIPGCYCSYSDTMLRAPAGKRGFS